MRCPTDSTELIITDRQGITVHYCPTCRGGWLEHAELDATIVRAAPNGMALREPVGVFDQIDDVIEDRPRRRRDKYSDDEYDDVVQERQRKGKKRRGKRDMFDDMFGF